MVQQIARIAVQIQGAHLDTAAIDTFRFSNTGVTVAIGDDAELSYYEPYISDSILVKQDAVTKDDSISIKLSNDGTWDVLDEYTFKSYFIAVYMSLHTGPNPETFYPLFIGKLDTVRVKRSRVEIKAMSRFKAFDEPLNPGVFSGVPGDYEGNEALKDKTKGRLIGYAFNVTPYLLNANSLIYGINWDKNGDRAPILSFDGVRDGGNDLDLDVQAGVNGDFATTALMDAYQPEPGFYVTCLNEATFKLGTKSVLGLTVDATESTNNYTAWLQLLATETDIAGYVAHSVPDYVLEGYFSSLTTYLDADKKLSENLDIAIWFDSVGNINASVIGSETESQAHFIEAGLELENEEDIPFFELERLDRELPPKKVVAQFGQNYTVQSQNELSGMATEDGKEPYKNQFQTISLPNDALNPDPFPLNNVVEINTSIANKADAQTDLARWLGMRSGVVDYVKLACPILSSNSQIIVGVVPTGASDYLNVSRTGAKVSSTSILVSDNNTQYTPRDTITLASKVSVTSTRFDYQKKNFDIQRVEINTRTMMATFTLRGVR